MKPKDKLALEQSTVREKINGLLGKDTLEDAERGELAQLTTRAQQLEIELRAAIVAGDGETETETETTDTPEGREFAQLLQRAEITDFMAESIFGESLDGAALELRQELHLPFGEIPLDLLDRPGDEDALETRADAATTITAAAAPQENQSTIAGRIFARTAGAYMGVDRPTVPVGTSTYVALTAGVAPDVRADGVAFDSTAATFTTKSVDPVRLTSRYLWGIESAARLRGMEDALRADLTAAMGDKLDKLALQGQAANSGVSPAVEGLIAQLPDPTNPTKEAAWDTYIDLYTSRVDGKYSEDGSNVRVLVNPETFRHAYSLQVATSGELLSDRLPAGRFRASANMPDTASDIAKVLSYAAGARRGFVQPVWRGLNVIRDPYTEAAKGQVALTVVLLAGAAMVDSGPYALAEAKTA